MAGGIAITDPDGAAFRDAQAFPPPSALAVEIAGSGIMLDLLCLRTGLFPLGMQIIHPCFDRE